MKRPSPSTKRGAASATRMRRWGSTSSRTPTATGSRSCRQNPRKKLGIIFLKPFPDRFSEGFGNNEYLLGFAVRNRARSLVVADISFLAESIELGDEVLVRADRKGERLNNSIVMAVSCGPVPGGRKGRRRRLKGGIVGNGQAPIGAQARGLAFPEIPIGQTQEFPYL